MGFFGGAEFAATALYSPLRRRKTAQKSIGVQNWPGANSTVHHWSAEEEVEPKAVYRNGDPGEPNPNRLVGCSAFGSPVHFTAGAGPESVIIGDFNGDHKLDLAVPNPNSNNVSNLLGNGDRTFKPAVEYSVGQAPIVAAVGDFNRDVQRTSAQKRCPRHTVVKVKRSVAATLYKAANVTVSIELPHAANGLRHHRLSYSAAESLTEFRHVPHGSVDPKFTRRMRIGLHL